MPEISDFSTKGFLIVMERPPLCMDMFDLVSAYGRLDETTARGLFTQVNFVTLENYHIFPLSGDRCRNRNVYQTWIGASRFEGIFNLLI